MQGQESDAAYFMRRATEEAILALEAAEPSIAAAHHGLSVQYAARARQAFHLNSHPEPSAFPQLAVPIADVIPVEVLRGRLNLKS